MSKERIFQLLEDINSSNQVSQIEKIQTLVDDITYASKGPELNELDRSELRMVIDGLSSALGMTLSHIRGQHKDPWEYIIGNVVEAYGRVFKVDPDWRKNK